jgi:GNAT superfamily N-acetyltransferase
MNEELKVIIERADPQEADILTEIAVAAKAHWGYPQRWMEMWQLTLTVEPETIRDQQVYVIRQEGVPIAFYALIGKVPALDLDQLWVRPEWIGKGLGKALVEHALALAVQMGAEKVDVQAEPHAEGFYLRMGARRVGEFAYELDGVPRVLPKLVFDLPPAKQA